MKFFRAYFKSIMIRLLIVGLTVVSLIPFQNCSSASTVSGIVPTTPQAAVEANQAIHDIVTNLSVIGVCQTAFANAASSISSQSSVTLSNLSLSGGLNLSSGAALPQYNLVVSQMILQSITNMTPLNGSGTARKGTLVFNATNPQTQQSSSYTVSDMAFYYNGSGVLTSCEVRQFVLFPNIFTLGPQLESASVPPAQLQLYQFIASQASKILNTQSCSASNGIYYPPFNQCAPQTANNGWPVMNEVYQMGLVYLLNRFHIQDSSVLATSNTYQNRVIEDLLSVTSPAGTTASTSSGFNYSNWFESATSSSDLTQVLQAAQTGLGVAVGLDWFRHELTPAQKTQIITAIQSKLLNQLTNSYQYYAGGGTCPSCTYPDSTAMYWWINSACNWNLDINGSLLVALKVLSYEVDPIQNPALASQMQTLFNEITVAAKPGDQSSLSYGITSINPATGDGAWFEGLNYYNYASENLASLMTTYSNSAINLPTNIQTGTANSLSFSQALRDSNGLPFGYSDNPPNYIESHSANFLYANQLNNAAATNYELKMLNLALKQPAAGASLLLEREYELALDLIWMNGTHLTQTTNSPVPTAVAFTTTNVGAVTDTTSGSNIYLAFKGEVAPSVSGASFYTHQHIGDAGGFIFNSDGIRWAQDFGADSYSLTDYDYGWIYFLQRAEGNNSISVSGEYDIDQTTSPLTILTNNSSQVVMSVNLSNANKKAGTPTNLNLPPTPTGVTPGVFANALSSMTRTYTVNLASGQGYALIEDDILASNNSATLTWNMNVPTLTSSSQMGNHITLTSGSSSLTLYAVATNGTIGSWSLNALPTPSAEGPFWAFGQANGGLSLFQGSDALPSGAKVLQLALTPAYNGSATKLQVYMVPGTSSFVAP